MRVNHLVCLSLLLSLNLMSCGKKTSQEKPCYDYDDIKMFTIKFEDVFTLDKPMYFVYVYSLNCLHCELIKNDVISYAFSNKVPMNFIEYYDDIPLLDDVSETIDKTTPKEIGILGTPSLLLIENKRLSLNVSGMDFVKNILNEYN